uniref:Uncharacterized protein n=1 Tax=Glycine max TaxID=3847 RepID=A0A0K0YGG3_SOYBN|nr:hypothetical protein [Glycine max]
MISNYKGASNAGLKPLQDREVCKTEKIHCEAEGGSSIFFYRVSTLGVWDDPVYMIRLA